jgi:endogenous inhibitor of DNA gyrase (YacG/DUF329 family)
LILMSLRLHQSCAELPRESARESDGDSYSSCGDQHKNKNGSRWLPQSKHIPKKNDNTERKPGQ